MNTRAKSLRIAVTTVAVLSVGALTVQVARSQVGGAVPSFVRLQPTSPGSAQTGNARVTGVVRAGQTIAATDDVAPRLSVEARTPVIGYGHPTVGATKGNAWTYLMGSDNEFGHALVWNQGAPMRLGAETVLGTSGFQTYLRFEANGNVGIGTTSPNDKLTVNGNTSITGTMQSAGLTVNQNATVAGTLATNGGRARLLRVGNDGAAVVYDNSNRSIAEMYGSNGQGVCGVKAPTSGNLRAGAFWENASGGRGYIIGDAKFFVEPSRSDSRKDYWYAAVEGPEAAMYVRGRGRLVDGKATVVLPSHFVEMMAEDSDTVVLTPRAPSAGLWAGEVKDGRFTVREVGGGRGSYRFDWEVKAVRLGYEDYQVERDWTARPSSEGGDAWAERVQMLRERGIPVKDRP